MAEDVGETVKRLFPDTHWSALWQPWALAPFLPTRGQIGDPVPMLEVHYMENGGTRACAVIALALDDYNDWQARQDVMRTLGERWALEGWQVLALRFGTCAWRRHFTDDEQQARGNCLVSTYDEKEEIVIVQGKTLDGREAVATAGIRRDKVGRVRGMGPWEVRQAPGDQWRFEMTTLDGAWQAYLRTVVRGWRAGSDPHC